MSSATPAVDRNLVTPQNLINPIPLYNDLRQNDPVHWSELIHGWVLTRYDDVMGAFRDPRLSADRMKFFEYQVQQLGADIVKDFMAISRQQMSMKEGPNHVRLRRQTGAAFTPMKLDDMRPAIHRTMKELLERVYDRGHMNLAKDISFQLPTLVIADLLGVPAEHRDQFKAWSERLADFAAPAMGADMLQVAKNVNQAMVEMKEYFLPIFEERRQNPGHDAISLMVQSQEHGKMTPEELVANTILLLFAGHTTTTDQLSNGVHDLLSNPDQYQKLREDPSLLRSAVEEMLRYRPAVPLVFRACVQDFELRGKHIKAGDIVFLGMAAANRDPAVFPDPDRFDVTRDSYHQKHLTFGFGAHHCMGAGLARRELEIGISMLLERLPNLRLDESRPAQVKCHSINFRGFDDLPVRW